jgi:hypothetical protein
LANPEWIANGEDDIADPQGIDLPEGDGWQFLPFDLQDGQIRFRVATDDTCFVGGAVIQ